ncbi:MAG: signal peptidase I [Lachnospiraceae bacterium]|nr:signal peptidase I [Lachnospiraceae bacterium]
MRKKNNKNLKEISLILLPVIIAIVFIFNFKIIKVDGFSMAPTLSDGQYILTSRHTNDIQKNSIVILKYEDELIVKRVAAVENDTVAMKDNSVYINGVKLVNSCYEGEDKTIELKKGEIFVLGDNCKVSMDSRYFGSVSEDQVISVKI